MLSMTEMFTRAIAIAYEAHKDDIRKFSSKEPYIHHPLRVAEKCITLDCKIVAMLHDVVEDHAKDGYTFSMLRKEGFTEDIIRSLQCLTKGKGETYFDFITKKVIKDDRAIVVKMFDLEDNMRDLNQGSMKDKYRFAYDYIARRINGN